MWDFKLRGLWPFCPNKNKIFEKLLEDLLLAFQKNLAGIKWVSAELVATVSVPLSFAYVHMEYLGKI